MHWAVVVGETSDTEAAGTVAARAIVLRRADLAVAARRASAAAAVDVGLGAVLDSVGAAGAGAKTRRA